MKPTFDKGDLVAYTVDEEVVWFGSYIKLLPNGSHSVQDAVTRQFVEVFDPNIALIASLVSMIKPI